MQVLDILTYNKFSVCFLVRYYYKKQIVPIRFSNDQQDQNLLASTNMIGDRPIKSYFLFCCYGFTTRSAGIVN